MPSNDLHRKQDEENSCEEVAEETGHSSEELAESSKGQKFWKTLDGSLVDVNGNDNLYLAVRQNLHKVNRVSRSSLSPLKNPRDKTDRGEVSRESSIGRFSAIKAFFDRDTGNEERNKTFTCKMPIMDKLIKTLGLKGDEMMSDQPHNIESVASKLDMNDNVISK